MAELIQALGVKAGGQLACLKDYRVEEVPQRLHAEREFGVNNA
jgi:hypothetical protein